jgi:hypothetical protein
MSFVKQLGGVLFAMTLGTAAMGCNADDPDPVFDNGDDPNRPRDGGSVGTEAAVPCTEEKSICIDTALPNPLPAAPTRLSVAAWKKVPITAPPDGLIGLFEMPQGNAGEIIHVRGSNPSLTGPFHIVATLYFPGGGTIVPKPGVDMIASSEAPYEFGNAPINATEVLQYQVYGTSSGPQP